MLTTDTAYSYGSRRAYNARVLTFGEALVLLRGKRKRTAIARTALGADAPTKDVRDFAAYLGLIEKGGIPNVGLGKLRGIATGHGFEHVWQLLERITALQSGDTHAPKGVTPPKPRGSRDVEKGRAVSPPTDDDDRISVEELSHAIYRVIRDRPGRTAATDRPTTGADPRRRKRRSSR